MDELSIIAGGPQGSGIETSMSILTRALARDGYWIFAGREYFSNIVGRHSYIIMRISPRERPRSLKLPAQILAASDAETLFTHFREVEGGAVIYNGDESSKKLTEIPSMEEPLKERTERELREQGVEPRVSSLVEFLRRERKVTPIPLRFGEILKQVSAEFKLDPRNLSRYVSSIVVSSIAALAGISEASISYAFSVQFRGREHLIEHNLSIYKILSEQLKDLKGSLKLDPPENPSEKVMVLTGNDAVAVGKVLGGMRYQSYYPITPAADESSLLERIGSEGALLGEAGPILVMQTEDEISAIASAIGASLTGARSSTATSGPGFDLMVEALSWAGMNEVPVVVTFYQRGGPSTGLPTRGSQSDLMAAIFSGHGEFSRVVISSGDHEEAIADAAEAFNIAEKYQVPVIHLLDKFLANSTAVIRLPNFEDFRIERGKIYSGGDVPYKRFDLSSAISPRAFIGQGNAVMWYTGDEHDEYGHITEDPENRILMYRKRMEKMRLIEEEIPAEKKVVLEGHRDPDFLIIGWGSVKGVAVEASERMEKKLGLRFSYVNVKMLWPFPKKEVMRILSDIPSERIIAAEHSYSASISSLMSMELGRGAGSKIIKYTGRPMMLNEFSDALEKIASGRAREVVLRDGA